MGHVDPDVEAFLDEIRGRLLGEHVATGRAEISRRADLSLPMVTSFWHALGFPVAQTDSGAFTQADLDALRRILELLQQGGDEQLLLG